MLKFLLLVSTVLISFRAVSQQEYFLYLQTDDRQPFYAKLSGQVYSSSENGYLIIPKLADGSYQLDIGFARSAFPEQHFPITINKKDLGLQIKNLGDKGWALYNFRNSELLASSVSASQKAEDYSGTRKTDNFSAMLANVVNDSAILYTAAQPPKPEAKPIKADTVAVTTSINSDIAAVVAATKPENIPAKIDSVKAIDAIDTPATVKTDPSKKEEVVIITQTEQPKQVPVQQPRRASDNQPSYTNPSAAGSTEAVASKEKPFIIRISENNSQTGYEAMYLEQYVLSTDTVRIIIPSGESETTLTPITDISKQSAQTPPPTSPVIAKAETPISTPVVKTETPAPKKTTLQVVNSDCKNFASDFDVDKLRVKIMSEYNLEDKLLAAKKVFKTRCFTVKQITALTELFTSDDARYQFFDAAYPFVSDSSAFITLESLIINDYYKNRFRAMVHK